jgi:hypothetical protein
MASESPASDASWAVGNEIIAEGTDWRFLNALKRELKA